MTKNIIQAILLLLGLAALGVSIYYAKDFVTGRGVDIGDWASAAFLVLIGLAALVGSIWAVRKVRARPD